jgi:hypothetical protein
MGPKGMLLGKELEYIKGNKEKRTREYVGGWKEDISKWEYSGGYWEIYLGPAIMMNEGGK